MALTYLAGQRLTADALQRAVPDRVVQAADQAVTSSTTLVDTDIVITVDGLLKIDLEITWATVAAGGGFKWGWLDAGSVSFVSRLILSPGTATSGTISNIADMQYRSAGSFAAVSIAQFAAVTNGRVQETLVADGSGTLTLQFAQNVSDADATTFLADSYALITRLGS